MINGDLLEQRGWTRWKPHFIWCYGSARLLWSVKTGFVVNGKRIKAAIGEAAQ